MENCNWKEAKLGDCSNIITGFPFKSDEYEFNGKLRVVRGENVTIGNLRWDSEKYWNNNTDLLERYFLKEDDIVIGMDGSRVGQNRSLIKTFELPLILAQRVARIRANNDVNQLFIWYNIFSRNFKEYVEAIHTGTSIPHISLRQIQDFEIQLPPLPEQKAIASVLSSLDDKIDLLHQQNQTLETLAETLFRQWFIEEAKEDWEVLPLCEIAEVKNGKSFKSSDFTDNDFNSYEVVKMGHIERGGGLKLNPKKDFVSREMDVEKWILNKGDIIMAMTDMKDNVVILGVPAMIDKDDHYVLNQRVARIYLKDNSKLISNYLLYIQLNSFTRQN